ncbi:MAG: patatin-like phospholipase family protein [Cyclobacteriaceae bacterium]|nr:patatin-like phospholipase family protein [Cyclobacteriaceae bacterium]
MKIGVALSGGGARGFAHLGVLQALKERNYEIARVSGCSAGAIMGAMFCQGFEPENILQILSKERLWKWISPAWSRQGLLSLNKAMTKIRRFIPEDSFADLKIPLTINATDLHTGKVKYFESGELIGPLMASSALPVIFEPVKIQDRYYIDGGISNNLPIEPLSGHVEKIIAINTNVLDKSVEKFNVKLVLERSLMTVVNTNSYNKKSDCDLFIEPPGLKGISVFKISLASQMYDCGYRYASELLDSYAYSWLEPV